MVELITAELLSTVTLPPKNPPAVGGAMSDDTRLILSKWLSWLIDCWGVGCADCEQSVSGINI